MSNAITKIDSQVLGELPTPASVDEAQVELIAADMPELNLPEVRSAARVGRFVAADMAGFIAADCVLDAQFLRVAKRKLMADLDKSKDARLDVAIAVALKDLVNASTASHVAKLKAVEIMAVGTKKERRKAQAPQGITGIQVTAENVQINSTPTIPAADVEEKA